MATITAGSITGYLATPITAPYHPQNNGATFGAVGLALCGQQRYYQRTVNVYQYSVWRTVLVFTLPTPSTVPSSVTLNINLQSCNEAGSPLTSDRTWTLRVYKASSAAPLTSGGTLLTSTTIGTLQSGVLSLTLSTSGWTWGTNLYLDLIEGAEYDAKATSPSEPVASPPSTPIPATIGTSTYALANITAASIDYIDQMTFTAPKTGGTSANSMTLADNVKHSMGLIVHVLKTGGSSANSMVISDNVRSITLANRVTAGGMGSGIKLSDHVKVAAVGLRLTDGITISDKVIVHGKPITQGIRRIPLVLNNRRIPLRLNTEA